MKLRPDPKAHRGIFLRARDGDTVEVLLDCGLGVWRELAVRLEDIESHEPSGETKLQAVMIAENITERYRMRECIVTAARRGLDCYGRLRGRVSIGGADLGQTLVADGLAWIAPSKPVAQGEQKSEIGESVKLTYKPKSDEG